MAQSNVVVRNEVCVGDEGGWRLCLQWCLYVHPDRPPEDGYRFIWRRENGNLQGARGQARLPSLAIVQSLIQRAVSAGWGDFASADADAF